MSHSVFGQRLSRDTKARKALLNNLANSLIVHGYLKTTLAKAKFAQRYIEKLVTKAKKDRLNTNRVLASKLKSDAFSKLVEEIGPGFESRQGGYTRIVKMSARRGDTTPMAKLEFLEWDKTKTNAREGSKVRKVAQVSNSKTVGGRKSGSNQRKSASKSTKSNKK